MALNYGGSPYFNTQSAPMFPQPNGNVYAGAEATQTSESTTDVANLSFTALIRVLPNCCAIDDNLPTTLTLVNTGIAATISNVAMTVVRL